MRGMIKNIIGRPDDQESTGLSINPGGTNELIVLYSFVGNQGKRRRIENSSRKSGPGGLIFYDFWCVRVC